MPKNKRLRHGIGAKISVYKKFLHPRALVSAKYPNVLKGDVLDDLLAVGQEEKLVCKRLQTCNVMWHEDFDDGQLLYAVARYCKVQQEGASEHLFNKAQQSDLEGVEAVAVGGEEVVQHEVPSILNKDASNFWAQGFEVDDNNNPAPKNLPGPNNNNSDCLYFPWGAEPLDARRTAGVWDVQQSMVNADATLHSVLGYFIHFLPVDYIKSNMKGRELRYEAHVDLWSIEVCGRGENSTIGDWKWAAG